MLASAARVELFVRPGCHLCAAAREVVARVVAETGDTFVERDVSGDAELTRLYGEQLPVVVVDGVQVDFWRVSEPRLRAALAKSFHR